MRTTCRSCGAALGSARERTIGRCSACPPTMDERLFEALREWRLEQSRAADVPAFVVFTDATLTAIAERVPTDVGALARINGVGPAKLERYGTDVLELIRNFLRTNSAVRQRNSPNTPSFSTIQANNPVAGRAQAPLT